jgi:N-acetylglucosaminyldiphosphoundecaprenol N-acetyl-beta-D-mannosaminyltransferase
MARNVEPVPAAESPLRRFQVLDVQLTGTTPDQAVATILGWVERREKRYVCVFAVDSLLKCRDDARLAAVANAAGMTLTDGMPLVWLGRHVAKLAMSRCYGPDLMIQTMAAGCGRGVRHYLYGGADGSVLDRLEGKLRARFPDIQIAGRHVPPHRALTDAERDAVVADIQASGADIVWVGIGTPKQDYWVGEFRKRLDAPALVAVGAAFNFHAGTVRQAPRWMMRNGLEWLFRLAVEPKRLWRRYLVGNPRFVALVLRQWWTRKPAPLGDVS